MWYTPQPSVQIHFHTKQIQPMIMFAYFQLLHRSLSFTFLVLILYMYFWVLDLITPKPVENVKEWIQIHYKWCLLHLHFYFLCQWNIILEVPRTWESVAVTSQCYAMKMLWNVFNSYLTSISAICWLTVVQVGIPEHTATAETYSLFTVCLHTSINICVHIEKVFSSALL